MTIHDQNRNVAVITGASSGIGYATALKLAQEGYNLVLGSRRPAVLKGIAKECQMYGVQAVAVGADVTKEKDVTGLARAAIEHFGSFDVWINNAAVTALGEFHELPASTFNHVMDTNFSGTVYGSRAALGWFRTQGRGTLINISSVYGIIPGAYETPYIASKFAVRGFTAALREELMLGGFQNIHACTILPATIDTPIYRNAANYTGRGVQPVPPLYPATKVADIIAHAIRYPRAEIVVGGAGRFLQAARALLPARVFENGFARYLESRHFTNETVPVTAGNITLPGTLDDISGKWPASRSHAPRKMAIVAAAASLAAALLLVRSRRRQAS